MSQTKTAFALPSESEVVMARETNRLLTSRAGKDRPLRLRILGDSAGESTLKLPASAVRLLIHILDEMAHGNAVTLIPVHAELTTQQAADMLQISRPSLIQLLDEGRIEFRRVGTHRRVQFESLMNYRRQINAERRAVLDELAAYDQEIGL